MHTYLQRNGYTVIPTTFFGAERRDDLLEEAAQFPEFVPGTEKFVMGGFGALGNPSSFHNMSVRKYRQWAHVKLVDTLFKPLVNTYDVPDDWYLDHMFGRMTIRVPGEKPSRESWHRDEASVLVAGGDDKVFGGWINLDNVDQFFSCVRGTHDPNTNKHRGFTKISKEAGRSIRERKLSHRVRIRPGHMLIFYENMVHEVLPKSVKHKLVRLHLAFRLTRSVQVRPPDLFEKMKSQSAMMIKSGQMPPMYAKLHLVNWVDKLSAWSQQVDKRCLVSHTFKTGKRAGSTHVVCKRFMKSLEEDGFPLYPEYTEYEKRLHSPSREWYLLVPGSNSEYKVCSL